MLIFVVGSIRRALRGKGARSLGCWAGKQKLVVVEIETVKLSYTALKTFQQCNFRYHLRYNRGLPSRPRPAAQSSRALHGALHLFHQGLKQQHPSDPALFPPTANALDTLLAHLKGYYDNPLRPLTDEQYQEGRALLMRYWEAYRGQFPTPYLLEEKFTLHVGPFVLTGRIDRVDDTPDGFEIIDYKLAQRSIIPPDPLQLDVYQLGFHAQTGEAAKKLSFYYLRTGQTETVEADEPAAAQSRVRGLCRDINREQEFHPQEGAWCASCDFREFCPTQSRTPRPIPAKGRATQLGFDF
ncbi:MAG: PD-(D/E)XK nuclease family protein [Deltaproteobacteria bacterium]|nr:PD-(D/E)XK nuclease family protein [Deltaproteobacteria bacterium]